MSIKSESSYFCTKSGQNANYSENEPSWKKLTLSMWLLRELMIPYAYPVMLECLNITYSVSIKSESSHFCTKIGQNVNYSENEPSWKKIAYQCESYMLYLSILASLGMHKESLAPSRATLKEQIVFRSARFLNNSHFGHL